MTASPPLTSGSSARHGRTRAAALFVLVLLAPVTAYAQRPRPAPPPPPASVDMPAAPHVEETLIVVVPDGMTAEVAAKRATSTSFTTKAATETALSAAAKTEAAGLGFAPIVTLNGSYTHFSNITPPSTNGQTFKVLFNYYIFNANLTVPITDYLVRINHEYSAATQSEEAARWDVVSARAVASANAKQAYYDWLRARGAIGVADQTLTGARAHAEEAKVKFGAGAVAGADVLRAEAAVSAAELLVEKAKANAIGFEWNLRTLLHAPEDEKLAPGESLEGALPPIADDLRALIKEAALGRPELKSIEKNAEAARKLGAAARGGRWPVLNAVADLNYSNPNVRKFPLTEEFFPSWSVGAVLKWSPNNALLAGPNGADQDHRAASFEAQRESEKDTIVQEVVKAFTAARTADSAIATTTRQLDSEREAYRVSNQLYSAGRITGGNLLDAQNALAQVRFDNLNAKADARIARIQLEHALGRDARVSSAP